MMRTAVVVTGMLLAGVSSPASAQLTATLESTLAGSNQVAYRELGWAVAVDADGTRAVVSGRTGGAGSAFAHVFVRNDTEWTEEAVLRGPAGSIRVTNVALSADGTTAAVGWNEVPADEAVHMYSRVGSTWRDTGTLMAPGVLDADEFGHALALDADGGVAVVSAPMRDVLGLENAGSIFGFARVGNTWRFVSVVASGTSVRAAAGLHLAISGDGERAIATHNDSSTMTRSAYVYLRTGDSWTEEAEIPESMGASASALDLDADGTHAIVGSRLASTGGARVFARAGSTWTRQALLSQPIPSDGVFGGSVGISSDGRRAIVGSWNVGNARLFSSDGTTWTGGRTINSPATPPGLFGSAVDFSNDGTRVVIGAAQFTVGGAPQVGRAYAFVVEEPAPVDAGVSPDAHTSFEPPPASNGCGCRAATRRSQGYTLVAIGLALGLMRRRARK